MEPWASQVPGEAWGAFAVFLDPGETDSARLLWLAFSPPGAGREADLGHGQAAYLLRKVHGVVQSDRPATDGSVMDTESVVPL